MPKFFIRILQLPFGGYKRLISPLLPNACRFTPTCSEYFSEAIRIHGVLKGSALGVWRMMRCNPMCKHGFDPVPPAKK